MSRGFINEDDQEEPVEISKRAVLPEGIPNYVTPEGFAALLKEQDDLQLELVQFEADDEREHRRKSAEIDGRLNLLNERINSARILDVKIQDLSEVKFGAKVSYQMANVKNPITIRIVGVDEANVKEKKVSFIAPISMALMNKKVGEKVQLVMGDEIRELVVLSIEQ